MFTIPFDTAGFPSGFPRSGRLPCSWPALLRSALLLSGSTPGAGRTATGWLPGTALEFLWRAAVVGANLRQLGDNRPLLQSDQYRGLDPSEKGAVSFFLGQVSAKHFAEHLLGSPIFTRVDSALQVAAMPVIGRRPDFYGYGPTVGVFATEAKGRSGLWTAKLMRDAKTQARTLPPILGVGGHRAVAHAAYFQGRQWKARIEDPPLKLRERGPRVEALLYAYYRPLIPLLQERAADDYAVGDTVYAMANLPEVDLHLGLRRDLLIAATADLPAEGRGAKLRQLVDAPDPVGNSELLPATALVGARRDRSEHETDTGVSVGADGVVLLVGSAWRSEVMQKEPGSRWASFG
jgi:hypothetical protein